jgi:murein DD-endopeptidase MepM/ murein hydrolase activator NlpD
LDVVLGGDPDTPNYLSLPTNSSVTVAFADETVIDGTGPDIAIPELVASGEQANVYVSSDYVHFTFLGLGNSGRVNRFDLAKIKYTQPVRAVKIVGLDNSGGSPGFDVVNVQAIATSLRPESFRYPIGNGVDGIKIANAWGGDGSTGKHGLLGEDYVATAGKYVFPFMWGKVINVISGDPTMGNAIVLEHTVADGSKLYSLYGHLSKTLVNVGAMVTTASHIGLTGSSGDSTSPNLRFGLFTGDPALAGTAYLGASFSNSLASVTDPNGNVHYKPSTFITNAGALNIGFAVISATGALTVNGTSGADKIALSARGGGITATRNGITYAFNQSIVTRINLNGFAGNDSISVKSGIIGAHIDGGTGNDVIDGGTGDDSITGGSGNDVIHGNVGDDSLVGAAGDDTIVGGLGRDRLFGGDGNDFIDANDNVSDTVDGGAGIDKADLNNFDVQSHIESVV